MKVVPLKEEDLKPLSEKTDRYSFKELKNLSTKRFVRIFVLKEEEEILGYSLCWVFDEEAELHWIEIFPPYRGKGLGKLLLKETLNYLSAEGVKKVFLEVEEDNQRALNLYRAFGFKENGRRKNYYPLNKDAIVGFFYL
jgi:ribosomal-protein-alanine N-acetyltransferase